MFNPIKKVATPALIIASFCHSDQLSWSRFAIWSKNFKKGIAGIMTILFFSIFLNSTAYAVGVQPEEKVFFYLEDHLGSVDVIIDEDGNVVERQDYLPYGKKRLETPVDSTHQEDYGFTGKELDDETNLMYYGSRYYDPNIGRFASLDPLVLGESSKAFSSVLANPQELNGYTYVMNNPLRYVDPTGEYGDDVHYTLTYYLGLKAGLSDTVANEIAFFNDRMDTDPATKPVSATNIVNNSTKKYHFQNRTEAVARLQGAMNLKDVRGFGNALHTYQDTYSHANLNGFTHGILSGIEYVAEWRGKTSGTNPDKTSNDINKAMDMAHSSFLFIRDFQLAQLDSIADENIKKYNQETSAIWNNVKGDVKQYLSFELKNISNIGKEMEEDDNEDK